MASNKCGCGGDCSGFCFKASNTPKKGTLIGTDGSWACIESPIRVKTHTPDTVSVHVDCGMNITVNIKGGSSTPGPTGPQGPQGAEGPVGAMGGQGLPGLAGVPGATGPQGLTGPQGPQGAVGPQGLPGIAGIQGPTGPQGPQGPTGIHGNLIGSFDSVEALEAGGDRREGNFYLVNGQLYYFDPATNQWLADGMIKGPQGIQGNPGDVGPTGLKGETGMQGTPGNRGTIGLQGPEGPKGPTGIQGPPGDIGPTGAPGSVIPLYCYDDQGNLTDPCTLLTTLNTRYTDLYNRYLELDNIIHNTQITNYPTCNPDLAGWSVNVIQSGNAYNFWGTGKLLNTPTISATGCIPLICKGQIPALDHYQGHPTLAIVWFNCPYGYDQLEGAQLQVSADGICFDPYFFQPDFLHEGCELNFLLAIILLPS